jgi:protein tyrosine phosphatase (PTP) superfamily phosphohydrolase (DUF442 family)
MSPVLVLCLLFLSTAAGATVGLPNRDSCTARQASSGTLRANLVIKEAGPGVYYGKPPQTADDYFRLRKLGVKTVIDMRKFQRREIAREQSTAASCGLKYRHEPVGYRPTRDCSPEAVLRILSKADEGPFYVHCLMGRDRTGLVVALYRVRCLGWSKDDAYAAMLREQFNTDLKDLERYFQRYAR